MQLTLVPKIELPPVQTQEYLFVVDRSGSMSGDRIATAKKALSIILRFIAKVSSISSFLVVMSTASGQAVGSIIGKAWILLTHVRSMEANYGGTEIPSALQCAFSQRNSSIPTMVFILTDGQVNDAEGTIGTVANAVAISTTNAPLRVFVLGIGNEVSTAAVEGIARAGNGENLFAIQSESIIGKCAKLIRAGRLSFVHNISIDWGFPENSRTHAHSPLSFSNSSSVDQSSTRARIQLSSPPDIQQTPARIIKIFPGLRFIVFALTTHTVTPKNIVLRGQLNGGSTPFEIVVPVSNVKPFDKKNPDIPLVHTLAARRLITDFLEDYSSLPVPIDPATPLETVRKAAVIALGEDYQLASKFTSFVAVDGGQDGLDQGDIRGRTHTRRGSQLRNSRIGVRNQRIVESILTFALDSVSNALAAFTAILGSNSSDRHTTRVRRLPGAYPFTPSNFASANASGDEADNESVGNASFSTMSSLDGSLSASDWSSTDSLDRSSTDSLDRSLATPPEDAARVRSPSPSVRVSRPTGGGHNAHSHTPSSPSEPPVVQLLVPTSVVNLIQLQEFDGSFSLNGLGDVIGESALQVPTDIQVDNIIWATALAVAFLRKHLTAESHSDVLEGLLDKVMEFIGQGPIDKVTFHSFVNRAMDLVL